MRSKSRDVVLGCFDDECYLNFFFCSSCSILATSELGVRDNTVVYIERYMLIFRKSEAIHQSCVRHTNSNPNTNTKTQSQTHTHTYAHTTSNIVFGVDWLKYDAMNVDQQITRVECFSFYIFHTL